MRLRSIDAFARCAADRSALALHVSPNLRDWHRAGLVDYTLSTRRHFARPSVVVDGEDLLIASEAAVGGEATHPCASFCSSLLLRRSCRSTGKVWQTTPKQCLDYTLSTRRHFARPSVVVDGEVLLIASEAAVGGEATHPCASFCSRLLIASEAAVGGEATHPCASFLFPFVAAQELHI